MSSGIGVLPQGYARSSEPPSAAYSHSASVGKRPPSHAQNANASNQLTQFMGSVSCPVVLHVWYFAWHCTFCANAVPSAAMEPSHAGDCQPLFGIDGCAPAPFAGCP